MTTPKKKKMTMKPADIARRRWLLERWDYICVICGHGFRDLACVTQEHIIPKSRPKQGFHPEQLRDNIGPSHYQYNRLRGTMSLLAAARAIERRRLTMSSRRFYQWLNEPVPNRNVPDEALQPPRPQRFLDLPEYLPGMP